MATSGLEERIIHSDDVQDISQNIRVLAGPGAGKTYWLVGQIRQILKYANLNPTQKVLCITYTNRATENITKRIEMESDTLELSTIHAFLYAHVIKPFFHLIADDMKFNIDNLKGHDDDIIINYKILKDILPSKKHFITNGFHNYGDLKKYISKFQWRLNGDAIELKSASKNEPPLRGFGKNDVQSYKSYVWKEYGLMHHDDVLYFTYQLISRYPIISKLLAAQYPYVLVDEYQDANSIQHWFFQKLAEDNSRLTIIGDQAQAIYSFAGADIKNILSFTVPNGELLCCKIEDNRRSVKSVVDFLNCLRTSLEQKSLRDDNFEKPMIMSGDIITAFKKAQNTCGEEDLYSLSWSNNQANAMKMGLSINCKENLLALMYDIDTNHDRTRFIERCIKAIENARQLLMKDALKYISNAFKLDTDIISDKRTALMILHELLHSYDEYKDKNLYEFYNFVISMDFIRNLTKFKCPAKINKIKDFYKNAYSDFAQSVNYEEDRSKHITIHKSKGSEFKNVFVTFGKKEDAMSFLLNPDLENKDDDHRLFYVACSRAENRLFLHIPDLTAEDCKLIKEKYNEIIDVDMATIARTEK